MRTAQKSRTREALLDGARDLIAAGQPVTIAAAAERAGISRATAYRYFSDPAVMAAEGGLAVEVLPYERVVAGATTPRDRVLAVSLYLYDLAAAHEPGFRRFLARALDAQFADPDGPRRRGGRRVTMFDRALQDASLDADTRRRLVLALSAASGIEALIGLHDVAGATPDEARRAIADTAGALFDRFALQV